MPRIVIHVSCIAVLLVGGCAHSSDAERSSARPAPPAPRTPVQVFMRQKLAHAQGLLEGIALEDFTRAERSARALHGLSEATDWQVHKTLPYQKFSADFRMLADDLAKNAEAKRLEAITLGYMELTMTCVKCHSYMRREGLVFDDGVPTLADLRRSLVTE